MVHVVIGLIVGIVMGLTGAGGALISIPLFLALLDATIKEATVLSLIAVLFGTSVNLLGKLSEVDKKIVFSFAVYGTLSNYLSMGLKGKTPDIIIAGLLAVIGIYSVWSVWHKGESPSQSHSDSARFIKLFVTGLFLGLVTTVTGLGGGVLLVPILMKFYGKTYASALPTSLATIFLISLSSFLFQGKTGLALITLPELGLIGVGTIISFYFLKMGLRPMSSVRVEQARKIVFTLVTIYAITTVAIKAF